MLQILERNLIFLKNAYQVGEWSLLRALFGLIFYALFLALAISMLPMHNDNLYVLFQ